MKTLGEEVVADLRAAARGDFTAEHRELLDRAAGEIKNLQAETRPSEALFAFMGWLTCRKKVSGPFSSVHDAAGAARLVRDFCRSQEFAEPRDGYTLRLKAYPGRPGVDRNPHFRATVDRPGLALESTPENPTTKGPHAEVVIIDDLKNPAPWPDPTPEMLEDPVFNAIWGAIKSWDINVPRVYAGYCGATGNHTRAIFDVLTGDERAAINLARPSGTKFIDVVFDGPPGPEAGRFVEVEDDQGKSRDVGNWTKRDGTFWALRFQVTPPARNPALSLSYQLRSTADHLWANHGPGTDDPYPGQGITVGMLRQLADSTEDLETQAVRRLVELGVELPIVDASPGRMPLSEECRRAAARDETRPTVAARLVLMSDMLEDFEHRARELLVGAQEDTDADVR